MSRKWFLFALASAALAVGLVVGGGAIWTLLSRRTPGVATVDAAQEVHSALTKHSVEKVYVSGTEPGGLLFSVAVPDDVTPILSSAFAAAMVDSAGSDPHQHPLAYRLTFVVRDIESGAIMHFVCGVSKSRGVVSPFASEHLWLYGRALGIHAICEAMYLLSKDGDLSDMDKARCKDSARHLRDFIHDYEGDDRSAIDSIASQLEARLDR